MEIRGIFYLALINGFPQAMEILPPEIAAPLDVDFRPDEWYDAGPYNDALAYLMAHTSSDIMTLLGNEFVEVIRDRLEDLGVTTVEEWAGSVTRLYPDFIRGDAGGGWWTEEFAPGRLIIREKGFIPNAAFIAAVIKRALEVLDAVNVRVTVINDRAEGAAENRYLVEWIEPGPKR